MANQAWLVISGVSASLWATRVVAKRQTLGRSSECDVHVAHKTVSRRHAEVWFDDNKLFIRDLGSRNGTLIDGERVTEVAFSRHSVIQIGEVLLHVVPSIDDGGGTDDETELLPQTSAAWATLVQTLSPGQVQVANLLLRGLNEKQVAERLYLSRHTVHTHVKRIYKLLDVQSRGQLLAKYLGRGEDSAE